MTPHFYTDANGRTASREEITDYRTKDEKAFCAGLSRHTMPACPAPCSSLIVHRWVTPAFVIDAVRT